MAAGLQRELAQDNHAADLTLNYENVVNTSVFHSCSYCEDITLPYSSVNANQPWVLSPTPKEALRAESDGCILFETLLHGRRDYPACIERGSLVLRPDLADHHNPSASCGWDDTLSEAVKGRAGYCDDITMVRKKSYRKEGGFIPVAKVDLVRSIAPSSGTRAYEMTNHCHDLLSVLKEAKSRLGQCHKHHACGNVSAIQYTPTRLVEVFLSAGSLSARIYTCKSEDRLDYATSSYRWGDCEPVVIGRATMNAWSKELPIHMLPSTIQDALFVTSGLGLRYLWVDCLCILQNVSNDKAHEIAKMPQIYENAYVTISAAGSTSCADGFLPRKSTYRGPLLVPRLTKMNGDGGEEHVAVHLSANRYDQDAQPIHTRAWTLQEHALSPRMLIFGTGHIKTICRMSTKVVVGAEFRKAIKVHASLPSFASVDYPLAHWFEVVKDYTSRDLTDLSDRLPAISGLAQKFADILEDRYVAGLWEQSLLESLLWIVVARDISDYEAIGNPRDTRLPGPTWSWCSLSKPVRWPDAVNFRYTSFAEFVAVTVDPAFKDIPYGMINSGRLKLKANVFQLIFRTTTPNACDVGKIEGVLRGKVEGFGGDFDIHYDFARRGRNDTSEDDTDTNTSSPSSNADSPSQVVCLELGRHIEVRGDFEIRGLVLEKVLGPSATYRRQGLWTYWASRTYSGEEMVRSLLDEWRMCMDKRKRKTITIV